jgi:hypothetical protein
MIKRNTLFIASEVRSGSTYIAEAIAYHFHNLYGHSLFDLTKEHFAKLNDLSTSDEILKIFHSLYLDQCGWAACKIMCPSLSIILRESRKSEKVGHAFLGANSHWIIVRRRSKIDQAVSLAFARKTGVWHSYVADDSPSEALIVGPNDVEEALRAILLSDTYLEALAGFIPENRKVVLYYEDFLSSPSSFIERLYPLLAPSNTREQVTYLDETKIRRNAFAAKHRVAAEFSSWLTENYHSVENGIAAHADQTRSATNDQVLFYENRIAALRREVEHLQMRLDGELSNRGRSKGPFELNANSAKHLKKKE